MSRLPSNNTSPVTLTTFPFEDQLASAPDDPGAFNKLLQKVKKSWTGIGSSSGGDSSQSNASSTGPLLQPWIPAPHPASNSGSIGSESEGGHGQLKSNPTTGTVGGGATTKSTKPIQRSASAAANSNSLTASRQHPSSKPASASASTTPFPMGLPMNRRAAKSAADSLLSLATSHGVVNHHSNSNMISSPTAGRGYLPDDIAPPSAHPTSAYPYASSTFSQSLTDVSSVRWQDVGAIPGFPLKDTDDTRSISSMRVGPSSSMGSVSHIFRRLRGEGLSKDYWMADESSKECYNCNTVFTTWRRKHHCRICGQIFCSRCASHLLRGDRFGTSGVVRVCDLCIIRLEENYQAPTLEGSVQTPPIDPNMVISAPIESRGKAPRSEFAASTLFGRPDHQPSSLRDSIWDTESRLESSRSSTPAEPWWPNFPQSQSSPISSSRTDSPTGSISTRDNAPFRNTVIDDDRPPPPRPALRITTSALDANQAVKEKEQQQIQPFPEITQVSSESVPPPVSVDGTDTGTDTVVPSDTLSPMTNSRILRRIDPDGMHTTEDYSTNSPVSTPDVGNTARFLSFSQRSRRESFGSGLDVMSPAFQRIRIILRQYLKIENIQNLSVWEDCLVNLLAKVGKYPLPNVKQGDHMDIRNYVHIKKIPGGTPTACEYVDGLVCTKNVLHKRMSRFVNNPRVMLLSFPLEYQRVENQLMSLEPLIKQEREYLRNLVARIVSARPHIVLVEKNVSGLALEYLAEANVAVARNVKPSVISAVHRFTQADIISSMDRLLVDPRLGRCQSFRLESFNHPLIFGRRKTIMRFEGCAKDLGCTIILRGGNTVVLQKIKRIMRTMILFVYSLRLETALLFKEQVVFQPHDTQEKQESDGQANSLTALQTFKHGSIIFPITDDINEDDIKYHQLTHEQQDRLTKIINSISKVYTSAKISSSPSVTFPPPYTVSQTVQLDRQLNQLRNEFETQEALQIYRDEMTAARRTSSSVLSDAGSVFSEASDLSSNIMPSPSLLKAASNTGSPITDVFGTSVVSTALSQASLQLLSPTSTNEDFHNQNTGEIAFSTVAMEMEKVSHEYAISVKMLDRHLRKNKDSLDAKDHQKIMVTETTISSVTDKVCDGPNMIKIDYYGEGDCTLGQYLEDTVNSSGHLCSHKGCEELQLLHYKSYVHRNYRVQVVTEPYNCPIPNMKDYVIMWSYCKKCCSEATPYTLIGKEAWSYSFGKYLELCFYHDSLHHHGPDCIHNAHLDHVRYFAYKNLSVRVHIDEVDVYNMYFPPTKTVVNMETQKAMRADEYNSVKTKITKYWDSVVSRLKTFYSDGHLDANEHLKPVVTELLRKAEHERKKYMTLLEATYKDSEPRDTLALNPVLQALQDKAVEWDSDFIHLEQRDVKRFTNVQLKRLFSGNSSLLSIPPTPDPSAAASSSSYFSMEPSEKTEPTEPTEKNESTQAILKNLLLEPDSDVKPDIVSSPKATSSATFSPTLPAPEIDLKEEGGYESDSTINAGDKPLAENESGPSNVADLVKKFDSPQNTSIAVDSKNITSEPESLGNLEEDIDNGQAPKSSIPRLVPLDRTRTLQKGDNNTGRNSPSPSRPPTRATNNLDSTISSRLPKRVEATSHDRSFSLPVPDNISTSGKKGAHLSLRINPPSNSTSSTPLATPKVLSTTSKDPTNAETSTSAAGIKKLNKLSRYPSFRGDLPAWNSRSASGLVTPTKNNTSKKTAAQGSGGRVSTIAKHFDRLSKEAEKDRQRRLAYIRGRRARPVALSKPVVQVFSDAIDAVSDDSDESSSSSESSDSESSESVVEKRKNNFGSLESQQSTLSSMSTNTGSDSKEPPIEISTDPPTNMEKTASNDISLTSPTLSDLKSNIDKENPTKSVDKEDTSKGDQSDAITAPNGKQDLNADNDKGRTDILPSLAQLTENLSGLGGEKGSIIKTISSFWGYPRLEWKALDYPMSDKDHFFADNSVIVREDEPSSIIALALCSKLYKEKIHEYEMFTNPPLAQEAFMPDDSFGHADRSSAWDLIDIPSFNNHGDIDDAPTKASTGVLRFQIKEGPTTFSCKTFFTVEFEKLRRKCGCDEQYKQSLARCFVFDSQGGKSGSTFWKTKDERFILKNIRVEERDSFLKFAQQYFEYMMRAVDEDKPTILAKVFGFYQITIKNSKRGKRERYDILVSENLFYGREINLQYDLKGGRRKRIEDPETSKCLKDMNLVEESNLNPLFIHEKHKKVLRSAIENDTRFLSDMNLVDYSLIAGIDKTKKQILVGIIDWMEKYTWNKKFESFVKHGGRRLQDQPTIIHNYKYMARFAAAMEGYFLLSADAWTDEKELHIFRKNQEFLAS